ncbi:hypothetical protein DEDE109153_13745 [Deinococcus deserti]
MKRSLNVLSSTTRPGFLARCGGVMVSFPVDPEPDRLQAGRP